MTVAEAPALNARTDALTPMEQRKHTRHLCIEGGVMKLSVRPEFKGRRGLLVDLSTGGIGFVVENEIEAGAVLVFEIPAVAGAAPIGRTARVRHCRPHPTPPDAPWLTATPIFSRIFRSMFGITEPPPAHAWLIGCEFDRPLTEAEIKQFLQALQDPRSDDA